MSMQPVEVLKILEANYKNAVALLPVELTDEFQRKVLRLKDLQEYAGQISIAIQFRDETSMLKIENWMAEHLNKRGFGHKMYQKGLDPARVLETLLKGIYDYK